MQIIITSPSLDSHQNVSGMSSVVRFITEANSAVDYIHFELGKRDADRRNLAWLLRITRQYFSWPVLLLSRRHAIVHFNLAIDKFGVLRDAPLLLFARILKRRLIIHLHGGKFLTQNEPPKWMSVILKFLFSGHSAVIVLSSKEAAVVCERFKCENVFVLPNCIDLRLAKKFSRTLNDDVLKILFIGRIDKAKGLEYAYRALNDLKLNGHGFLFSLAGRGPDEKEFVRKFAESLGSSFIFHGVVDGKRKLELLQHNTVFLLPSLFEGLPISLLECMAFGLIPIATPVGSIPDIINNGENGFIVKLQSVEEIENAIVKLESDAAIRNVLSNNARKVIFENYDPDQYVKRLNNIYRYEQDRQLSCSERYRMV